MTQAVLYNKRSALDCPQVSEGKAKQQRQGSPLEIILNSGVVGTSAIENDAAFGIRHKSVD